jgi:hypothetical protein
MITKRILVVDEERERWHNFSLKPASSAWRA